MKWWLAELSAVDIARKICTRIIPNLHHLPKSRVRTCRACSRPSLILACGAADELHICVRCRANLRYELLAAHLRATHPDLSSIDVLELDPASPLRPLLGRARTYLRSFYRDNVEPGTVRDDGAICEDITQLTLADCSLDLIISSDVLEHVPDPAAAFRESARVLRRGGAHVFTVPPRARTVQRAKMENGAVRHLVESPEYHYDPLDPNGVLAFWDYGPDLPERFGNAALEFRVVAGPEGANGRIVWAAHKRID